MSGTILLGSLIEKEHIKCRNFENGRMLEAFGVSNTEGIVRTTHRKSEDLGDYLVIKPGSFAYNPYRVNVGSIGLTPVGIFGVVSPAYVVFRVQEGKLVPEVLLDFLKSSEGLRQINKLARGTVRKALRFEDLCEIEFPTITYEQQLEILEHKQGFNQKYRRLLSEIENQQSLLTKIKQAILQEAIQGRLTADWRATNPDVEPASQLLQRIQMEKARLISAKKLRPEKQLSKIASAETPFEIPKSWEWCRPIDVCEAIVDCPHSTPKFVPYGKYCIDSTCIDFEGRIHLNHVRRVANDTFAERNHRLVPVAGDIIYVREGLIGQAVIVPNDMEVCLGQRVMLYRPSKLTSGTWLRHVVTSKFFLDEVLQRHKGMGAKHINMSDLRSMPLPLPPLAEQKAIIEKVELLMEICRALETEIEHSRTHAANLLQAVLREAFSDQPVAPEANDEPSPAAANVIPFTAKIGGISTTDLHAGILAKAYQCHASNPEYLHYFGHVKAEKIAHLVEAHLGIELGRQPIKAAAGPNDYPHLKRVESRAKKANWFTVQQKQADSAYIFNKQNGFDALLGKTNSALGEYVERVDNLIKLLLPLNTRQAEVVATLYAAWNNLLLLGKNPTDEEIVYEARENWHSSKLKIEQEKFFKGLEWMRKGSLVPVGKGKCVN